MSTGSRIFRLERRTAIGSKTTQARPRRPESSRPSICGALKSPSEKSRVHPLTMQCAETPTLSHSVHGLRRREELGYPEFTHRPPITLAPHLDDVPAREQKRTAASTGVHSIQGLQRRDDLDCRGAWSTKAKSRRARLRVAPRWDTQGGRERTGTETARRDAVKPQDVHKGKGIINSRPQAGLDSFLHSPHIFTPSQRPGNQVQVSPSKSTSLDSCKMVEPRQAHPRTPSLPRSRRGGAQRDPGAQVEYSTIKHHGDIVFQEP